MFLKLGSNPPSLWIYLSLVGTAYLLQTLLSGRACLLQTLLDTAYLLKTVLIYSRQCLSTRDTAYVLQTLLQFHVPFVQFRRSSYILLRYHNVAILALQLQLNLNDCLKWLKMKNKKMTGRIVFLVFQSSFAEEKCSCSGPFVHTNTDVFSLCNCLYSSSYFDF